MERNNGREKYFQRNISFVYIFFKLVYLDKNIEMSNKLKLN